MDDKLFYVESPDGQVLGPMTMINILEGIAAGAVLDDARVCEVGQAGWANLSDLACAREEAAPEPEFERPRPVSSVRKLPDDFLVQERWAPPESASATEDESVIQDAPDSFSLQMPHARAEEPDDSVFYEDTLEAATYEAAEVPSHETRGTEGYESATGDEPMAPLEIVNGAPSEEVYEVEEWADATQESAPLEFDESSMEPLPESASHYDEADNLVAALRAKATEFSLDLADAEDEDERAASESDAARESSPRRLALPWPVLALGAAAVAGGLWFGVGAKLFRSNETPANRGDEPTTQTIASAADAAWSVLMGGDATAAIPMFHEAIRAQPNDARAQHGLGRAALLTGDLELATTHLERATSLSPDDARIRLDLGTLRLREGRWQLAIEEAEQARLLAPEAPESLLLLGRAHATGGHHDEAVRVLASYITLVPKNGEAHKDLSLSLAAAGRVAPAIDEMNAYLVTNPGDGNAQETRLGWMISLGEQAAAGRLYGEAAAKQPDDGFANYLAGIACTGTEEGVTYLRRAVEITPSHRDSWKRLAEAHAAIGRNALAVEAMTQAGLLAPADAVEEGKIAAWRAATPPLAQAQAVLVAEGPIPTLADRVGEIRRALGRGDFGAARRALASARAELKGPEAGRNLALWNAIADFEEGRKVEAKDGFAALNAEASYLGFDAGAVYNWAARSHLALGDVRGAIGILDEIGPERADEYAAARLWEGIALSSLGMDELAYRTWTRLSQDVGSSAGKAGGAAVRSAEFLAGALAEKDYRTAVAPVADFENDMHFFLGWAQRTNNEEARRHFRESMDASHGREFPYHLARGELEGTGLGAK